MLQWKEIDQNDLMDSKLRCVFAMPPALEDQNGIKKEAPASSAPEVKDTAPVAMKAEEPGQMNAAVGEIKKLNESLSQLRQENINLKVSVLISLVLREDKKSLVLFSHGPGSIQTPNS